MKTFTRLAVAVLVFGCGGAALGQADPLPPGRVVGSLIAVDGNVLVMRVAPARGPRKEVMTIAAKFTREQRYLINGVAGKLEDLKPGMPITFGLMPHETDPRRPHSLVIANTGGPNGAVMRVEDGRLIMEGWRPGSDKLEEMIIASDDQTQITVMGRPGKLTDIQPQMLVNVIPLAEGAGRLIVANDPDHGPNAIVIAVEGEELVVQLRWPEVRISVDETMGVMVDGARATLADLSPPMEVYVQTRRGSPGIPGRTEIIASSQGWKGILSEVNGNRLTIEVREPGGEKRRVTVITDESTVVRFPGLATLRPQQGTVQDLKPGVHVTVTPREGTVKTILATPFVVAPQP